MKKTFIIFTLALLILSSCSGPTYYQVYEIQSQDVSVQNNLLTYENADCSVKYNTWSEGGNLSFLITNKTDNNLYIVMPKSFFILNGVANDYYSESSYTRSITNSAQLADSRQISISGFLTNGFYWYPTTLGRQYGASVGTSLTEAVETKEAPFVCVPPRSSKFIKGFNISDYIYKDCNNSKFNYPSKVSPIVEYQRSNTPLSFRNRIAYTFDEKSTDTKYMDHYFWMSSIRNYSRRAALSKHKYEECETKIMRTLKSFTMSAPNKFFNEYKKNTNNPVVFRNEGEKYIPQITEENTEKKIKDPREAVITMKVSGLQINALIISEDKNYITYKLASDPDGETKQLKRENIRKIER